MISIYWLIPVLLYMILSFWVIIVQIQRNNKLVEITNNVINNFQEISKVISKTSEELNNPKLEQAFSKDDEVGLFFDQIKEIQSILDNFTIDEENIKEETTV